MTVGYVPAPGLSGDFSLTAPTEPTKYMDYAFEKVDGVYYLRALAVSEMKPSSSAAANAPETDLDYEDYFDPTSVIAGNADSLPGEDTSSPASDSAQEDTSAADSAGDEATSDAGEE